MGKLYKIRRAIEREPEKWYASTLYGTRRACRATRGQNGGWIPGEWWFAEKSYCAFVRHVLRELGYDIA